MRGMWLGSVLVGPGLRSQFGLDGAGIVIAEFGDFLGVFGIVGKGGCGEAFRALFQGHDVDVQVHGGISCWG